LSAASGVLLQELGTTKAYCPSIIAQDSTTVFSKREPKLDRKFHLLKGQYHDYDSAKTSLISETTPLEPGAAVCPYRVKYSLFL
jgi:hypothetical protein